MGQTAQNLQFQSIQANEAPSSHFGATQLTSCAFVSLFGSLFFKFTDLPSSEPSQSKQPHSESDEGGNSDSDCSSESGEHSSCAEAPNATAGGHGEGATFGVIHSPGGGTTEGGTESVPLQSDSDVNPRQQQPLLTTNQSEFNIAAPPTRRSWIRKMCDMGEVTACICGVTVAVADWTAASSVAVQCAYPRCEVGWVCFLNLSFLQGVILYTYSFIWIVLIMTMHQETGVARTM